MIVSLFNMLRAPFRPVEFSAVPRQNAVNLASFERRCVEAISPCALRPTEFVCFILNRALIAHYE